MAAAFKIDQRGTKVATVEFRGIGKTFDAQEGAVRALDGIDLKLEDGEFLSLIGPSGCGKSSLLEIAAGLSVPTEGQVLLDGEPQSGTSRDIGVVFQDSALLGWRTIRRNVGLGLEIAKVGKAEIRERVQRAIELVGLRGFEERYPHQLSGGMRQRAGLARTLVNDPRIILMDEPFSAVDHLTRIGLQDEIVKIWRQQKKTILFVTHDVSEAVYLADRVALLSPRPGKIQAVFKIPSQRPRKRGDMSLIEIVEKIYLAINTAGQNSVEPEYVV
jgi:NitT/TauT family transport system ATP-binding protein